MKNERYTQALISVLVAVVLFATGFYAGKKDSSISIPPQFLNATSTNANMASFWKAWEILDQKFTPATSTTPPINSEDKLWGSIEGLASSYKDPYTIFFPPVESKAFEEDISGSFGGVGMEIALQDGTLTVVAPLKNTPADNAGVLAGDKILMIEDVSALNMTASEAVKIIRGEKGTPVVITFVRKGETEPLVKTLVRANIDIPTISTRLLPSNVFVIELYSFSATSPNLFRGALREFIESGSNKLILDLRNNPGGYLEAALDMASWFLPTGKVVVTEDFGNKEDPKIYRSKGYDIFTDQLKFAILVNEGSASASEILAGALREYNKATLVGNKTFGKGSVQDLTELSDGSSVKLTIAKWYTPNDRSISQEGIVPDVEVELTAEDYNNDLDPQLKKAIEILK